MSITIIPAEHGTLSFHSYSGDFVVENVVAFSVETDKGAYDSKFTVDPINSNMLLDVADWIAVYHPKSNLLAFSDGPTVEVANKEEAKRVALEFHSKN